MRIKQLRSAHSKKPPSPERRRRAKLTANVLRVLDEWLAHPRPRLDLFVEALLLKIEWDHVKPSSLRALFSALCDGLRTSELSSLSSNARREGEVLAAMRDAARLVSVLAADDSSARAVRR